MTMVESVSLLRHILDYWEVFSFGFIPWWVYWGLGIAGAVAAVMLIPAPRLGLAVAALALVAGTNVGSFSVGFKAASAIKDRQVEAQKAAEKERLNDAFAKGELTETQRAAAEKEQQEKLEGQARDAIKSLAGAETGTAVGPDTVVIPEPAASRLRNIRGRR